MSKVTLQSQARVPTEFGRFDVLAFAQKAGDMMPHVVMVSPHVDGKDPVVLRIHSECMTGDVFHSLKCDCKDQLQNSLDYVQKHKGIVIYLRQEGRGIGLIEKLKAYQLQDQGLDTVDANLKLGHQADERDYEDAIDILEFLGVKRVRLLTNNPEKVTFLNEHGIEVIERIPIVLPTQEYSEDYFATKKYKMGHIL